MKTFSFSAGSLEPGIGLRADEKFGQVVFLGEVGRGRRFEKVSLDRRSPAEVINGRVEEAQPKKIILPPRDGKPEKVFYVLEKPETESEAVLVRINTYTDYIKNGRGYWEVVAGQPETLISGYGAFGDAGRVGNWDDSLVIMMPGDALRVYPSRGSSFALWVSADGKLQAASWQDYENLMAVEQAEAKMAEAEKNPETLIFATMPAYTWQDSEVRKGISLSNGATGKVVAMGEGGRGRKLTEVPIVGFEPVEFFEEAAVLKLGEKEIPARYSWESPTTKVIYGLTQAQTRADGFLVRVTTEGGYTRRGSGKWEVWKGNPILLAEGHGADGEAGGIGSWSDGLWVLHEGDVFWVRQGGGCPTYALWVEAGQIRTERWAVWKASDGLKDPAFYVAKGTAPWDHVPTEWIGRVVMVQTVRDDRLKKYGETGVFLDEGETGELISINPLVLNLGWDGCDQELRTIAHGTWVNLENDKKVHRPEGDELVEREALKEKAEELRAKAKKITEANFFEVLDIDLQQKFQKLAEEEGFKSMPSKDYGGIEYWISDAERIFAKLTEVQIEAETTAAAQAAGEVLRHFEAYHRRGGKTFNGDGWVIQKDGSLRKRDSDSVPRHKYDGTYHWDLVEPEELALRWRCNHVGDVAGNSTFEVVKMPVGGLSSEQLETVRKIETEIGASVGAFGLN